MPTVRTLELSHIGIRVSQLDAALAFYGALGFRHVAGPFENEPVVILQNQAGAEINLIVNAPSTPTSNILMDIEFKHPGVTHVAYWVDDLEEARQTLASHGIIPRGDPVVFPNGIRAIFVRDPDMNVVELDERPKK